MSGAAPSDAGAGRSRAAPAFVAALAVSLAVFVPVALGRLIVRDEGFYLLAAGLASGGRLPYLDFFYPQMPALPYLYGGWLQLVGPGWVAARLLSALLASATGALLFTHVRRRLDARWAALGLALYLGCDLVLCWYSVVKFYAASSVLLLGAVLAAQSRWRRPWAAPLVAGLCVGLAVDVRLLLVVAAPVLWAFLAARARRGAAPRRAAAWFAAGFALGLAPALPLLAAAPDAFVFDNVGYHLLRSDAPSAEVLQGKLRILLALAGIGSAGKGWGLALPLLLWGALARAVLARRDGRPIGPATWLAAALLVAHFVPSPAYVQYFAIVVPLLIPSVVELCRALLGPSPLVSWRAAVLGALLIVYLAWLPSSLRAVTGAGDRDEAGERSRSRGQVTAVRAALDAAAAPGEVVYASWPGFLVGSHTVPLPGTENPFGIDVASRLAPERRRRYRVLADDEIRAAIAAREVRVLVLPQRLAAAQGDLEAGYAATARVGGLTVYTRR